MHKKLFYLLSGLFVAALTFSCALQSGQQLLQKPETFTFKPVHYKVPSPARVVLNNGMVLYLLEDHELPLIEMTALIRTGSIYESPDYAGLASLSGDVMRTGGTKTMSPEKIDEALEYIDAQIAVSIETESGSASLSVMQKDFDQGFDIFTRIIRSPAFAAERLAIAKEQKIAALRQTNDNPQSLAFRQFKKLLYHSNPRGNLPTIDSIERIEPQDLQRFYQTYFHPNRIILGVSGDFSSAEMITKIIKSFGDWKAVDTPLPTVAPPQNNTVLSLNYLQKKVPQSTIILGNLAPTKQNPDYYAFEIVNYILGGGGFSSLLTSEIRSNRGLAYSVGSFYRSDVDYGVFGAYCMTKSSSTAQALELMFDIIKRIGETDLAGQLKQAKESLINSFIFAYTSSSQMVAQTMSLEYDHLPPDFLTLYPAKIEAVTLDDVKRAARNYLHPEQSIVLVVGNGEALDKSLTRFGPVREIYSDIR
jgi:predicted Zn-dependent peptidase